MKLITLIALGAMTLSAHAVQFNCSNTPSMSEGLAALRGRLNMDGGKVEFTGDGIYSSSSTREVVTFFRNKRQDEEKYSFAKFTGGGNYHLFYLSVPKRVLEGKQTKFAAFLNFLREGVGGMAQYKVDCKTADISSIMQDIIKSVGDYARFEDLQGEGFANVAQSVSDYNMLPKAVKRTLKNLKLNIMNDWDVLVREDSPNIINFSSNQDENGAHEIVVNGVTQGYTFNIDECTIEECAHGGALFLDADGFVLKQSF